MIKFKDKRLLVVGAGELGQQVMKAITHNPNYGYRLVGLLDDHIHNGYFKKDYGVEVLGRTNEVVEITDSHSVDKVIIALPFRAHNKIARLIDSCESAGIETEVVPDFFNRAKPRTTLRKLNGLPLLTAASSPMNSWTYTVVKRAFDIAGALLLLLALSPLLAIVALLIKLSSPGPIFFAQERIGRNGRRFNMLKFRSMLPNAQALLDRKLAEDEELRREWFANFKLRKDPRITPIGVFIRKTSLDEFPQLLNVLRGEMSLVGPRPLPLYHHQEISPPIRVLRSRALPGMTGLWQVSGRSDLTISGMEKLDLHYVQRWSFKLDLMVLLKTFPAVIRGAGAV
jgi:exopolysaccharide biosynthesis polyprenyl glycosylphosphotransferase